MQHVLSSNAKKVKTGRCNGTKNVINKKQFFVFYNNKRFNKHCFYDLNTPDV